MPASTPLPSNVKTKDVEAAVARYPNVVHPKLAALDAFRYRELPNRVAERLAKDNEAVVIVNKDELVRLVDWKLHHGTYRPALLAQVKSNDAVLVEQTVCEAVKELRAKLDKGTASAPAAQEASKAVLQAVNALSKPLRGIGPATASLVLAVCMPKRVPFFSDELWRWTVAAGRQQGGHWVQAKIGYNVKEYALMLDGVRAVQDRLAADQADATPDAVKLEQAAYVWARDVNGKISEPKDAQDKSFSKSNEALISKSTSDSSKKRKKSRSSQEDGRTRSSTRRRV